MKIEVINMNDTDYAAKNLILFLDGLVVSGKINSGEMLHISDLCGKFVAEKIEEAEMKK